MKFLFLVSYFFLILTYTTQLEAQCVPPTIILQPVSKTVCEGSTVFFQVVTGGGPSNSFQWKKNGINIPGATSSVYIINSPTPADSGSYTVFVSNACGSITSDPAILTVNSPPTIAIQPTDQMICAGTTATFSVTATGTAPFSYQWSKNGISISGATSATYTTPPATSADNGALFSVTITNACGSVNSNTATLTVNSQPTIAIQPTDQMICAGTTATFSVTATGTAPFSYQWSKNGISIIGATSATYTTPPATSADNGALFSVTITNACGSVNSNTATLTVNSQPTITIQPTDQTVCAGTTVTFSVTASGSALSYQWYQNGIAIVGATSSTYTTTPVTSADNGAIFNVIVTNSCGSTTSSSASLIIGSSFTFTTTTISPTNENGADGSITFTVTSGMGPFLYSINNGASFETSNTFFGLPAGVYNLVVKNGCGMQTCQVILFSPQIAATRVNTPIFGSSLGSNIISYTQPSHGTVIINPDGTYVYQPNECFSGDDSFTYTVTNPCSQTTNTVLIAISFWTSCKEDPKDPIYNPFPKRKLPEDYYPCVLFNRFENDDFVYRMWHQGPNGIAMSESHDGNNWKFVGNTNLEGTHPCVIFNEKGFRNDCFQYMIWFWTGEISTDIGAIQYSFSNDGIHWLKPRPITQDPSKPLVFGNQGTPFYQIFGPGFVLFNPFAKPIKGKPYTFQFVMFYDVSDGSPVPGAHSIGLAYSKDGIHWKRYGSNPILNSGNSTDWDGTNVFRPSIIKVEGAYHLFYSGSNVTIDPATTVSYAHGIGHASSNDGVNWIKDPDNPIFIYSNGVEWRNSRSYTPFVLYDDFENVHHESSCDPKSSSQNPRCLAKFLKMWFGGGMGTIIGKKQGIGYATWPCCKKSKITFPPSDFIGIIIKNECTKGFILISSWKASPSPRIKSYRIYKNGKIVATIAANRPLEFNTSFASKDAYFEIVAVSKNNIESSRIPLRIIYKL